MAKKTLIWPAFVMMSLIVWWAVPAAADENKAGEGKVAVVNSAVIPRADFDSEVHRAMQVYGMGKAQDDSRLSEIKNRALENLIEREVLYQESRKKGIKVEEADITTQLDALKKRFPSEEEFEKELSRMRLSEGELRGQLERAIATQRLVDQEVVRHTTVSDQELRDFFEKNKEQMKQPEQVRASHILIKVDPKADAKEKEQAKAKIEKIAARIKKGEDFSALAKESSQCPSSSKGGDLGYFGRGQMVKPFADAAFALKPGELSGIVETTFGYHLIKIEDRKPETVMNYDDVKDRLGENLKQQKVHNAMGGYVGKLKNEAKIERFLPEGAAADK